jgi:riboflavin biosynthesis pyrimidine reductase
MHVKTLYDRTPSAGLLSSELQHLYEGDLNFPEPSASRPFIIGNFVQTLDGIVSLKIPGRSGGGAISGRNEEDMFIMGLLRSCADAVLIGGETYRVAKKHLWTPEFIYPKGKGLFEALRRKLGKRRPHPLTVIASGKGTVDLNGALFRQPDITTLIFTTKKGKEQIEYKHGTALPCDVQVLPGDTRLHAGDIAETLYESYGVKLLLHEGGPTLFASFLEKHLIDELFLTIAPQIVGRGASGERPNFSGLLSFDPEHAVWATLLSVKRAEAGHLFLRYGRSPHGA